MTDEPIRPALTPDEWREMEIESHYGLAATSLRVDHKGRLFARSTMPGEEGESVVLNEAVDAGRVLPAVAALCLYGQPFGFSQADVELLREEAARMDFNWGSGLRSIADRIAALLPPAQ